MPSPKKVAWSQLRVGVMAIIAMAVLVVMIFLLTGSKGLFAPKVVLYTYLDDSAALTEGSAVRLNGHPIGAVKRIELSGSKEPKRIIRMELSVREEFLSQIPVDSLAAIGAENVLGTKYVNIKKGSSAQTIKAGGEVPSLDTREFDEVVQSGYALLTSLQGILKRVDTIVGLVETGKGSIGKLLVDDELYNRLLSIERDVQKVSGALASGQGTVGKLLYDDTLYQEIRTPVARIDSLLQDLQQGQGTAGKLLKDEALYTEIRATVKELRRVVDDINAGKGSAGKLLKSDELHNRISSTVAHLDTMLERLNAGQGTMGQLLVNPQLYQTLNGMTAETHDLIKDFRANPKKFLRIKLALF
ncbi:MAG: MCE family protein [Acidobacteria bacterium]|nr:MCE family protein [Acidobacteriota bacterium]